MLKRLYSTLLMAATFVLGQGRTREIGLITELMYTYLKERQVLYKWIGNLAKNGTAKVNKKNC
jgi:hypothetical protein